MSLVRVLGKLTTIRRYFTVLGIALAFTLSACVEADLNDQNNGEAEEVKENTFIPVLAPTLTTTSDFGFPTGHVVAGNTIVVDVDNVAGNYNTDKQMSYLCYYDQVIDDAVAAATACSSLPGTGTFVSHRGRLTWATPNTAFGPYEVRIEGTNSLGTDSEIFVIDVRQTYLTGNLLLDLDAQFATRSQPGTNPSSTWYDLTSNGYHGTLLGGLATAGWAGAGTLASPHVASFNGTDARVELGNVISSQTQGLIDVWVSPSNATGTDDIIATTGGDTADGFVLKQSNTQAGKVDLIVGKAAYYDLVMANNPYSYWRLNETSGTIATDLGTAGKDGTYTSGFTLSQTGALTGDNDLAAGFDGGTTTAVDNIGVAADYSFLNYPGVFTVMGWSKNNDFDNPTNTIQVVFGNSFGASVSGIFITNDTNINQRYRGSVSDGTTAVTVASAIGSVADNNWHFVALVGDGSNISLYVDGALVDGPTAFTPAAVVPTHSPEIGNNPGFNANGFDGTLDEIAVFQQAFTAAQIADFYNAGLGTHPDHDTLVEAKYPVGYWRLNELSGTTATDSSATGANGTYTGGYTLGVEGGGNSDSTDRATDFDGVDARVTNLGSTATYQFIKNSGIFSASAWVRVSDFNVGTDQGVFGNTNGGTPGGIQFYYEESTNQYTAHLYDNTGSIGQAFSPALTNNLWHHVAVVGDGTNITVYLDATAGTPVAFTGGAATGASQGVLVIGDIVGGGGSYIDGVIDEVAIWNRALSAAEITALYNNTYYFKCQSSTVLANSSWYNLSALWDGTTATLFVNGEQECSVTPTTAPTFTASTDLSVGATDAGAKFWAGSVGQLKGYSSATAANVNTNFQATCNRFFEPDDISNLIGWWKADAGITLTGSDITGWLDQSGNGNDGAFTAGKEPDFIASSSSFNNKPVARFVSANTDVVTVTGINNTSFKHTFIFAARIISNTGGSQYLFDSNGGTYRLLSRLNASDAVQAYASGTIFTGSAVTLGQTHVLTYLYSASTGRIFIDGTQVASATTGLPPQQIDGAPRFGGTGGCCNSESEIAEVLYYNRDLTDAERGAVECYLGNKYAITIN